MDDCFVQDLATVDIERRRGSDYRKAQADKRAKAAGGHPRGKRLSQQEWKAHYDAQGRCCAICHMSAHEVGALVCDHNHQTGAFRALLCRRCNVLLGWGNDDPNRLRAAADYLEKHSAE